MNFTEQKNYIIAAFVSLIIHFFIFIIYLPGIPAPQQPVIEEVSMSLVEISPENKIRRISVALNLPGKGRPDQVKPDQPSKQTVSMPDEATAVADTPRETPEIEEASKDNTEQKSAVKPDQALDYPTAPPEKKAVTDSDNLALKPEEQDATGGNAGGMAASGVDEQQSFGTGEAMVKIIGPMPTYPPAALKEGKEGEVTLRILVNADGELELVIVTRSSGDIRLDYAATSSVERKWKFTSISQGYFIDITFSFDIHIGASVKFLASKTRS
jgi:TonB family protein